MKVTIIGAGNMGRAIGTRAVAGGHEVGPLRRARQLEQSEFLHIAIQEPLRLGGSSAMKLLP